jgi:hypothetical protein
MSNVRDKKWFYLDICGEIKRTMRQNWLALYNEIILINVVWSAMLRVNGSMKNRKVARVHQEVLVFYKWNPKEIQKIFPKLEKVEGEENVLDSNFSF